MHIRVAPLLHIPRLHRRLYGMNEILKNEIEERESQLKKSRVECRTVSAAR
jgi:hypothetical protein